MWFIIIVLAIVVIAWLIGKRVIDTDEGTGTDLVDLDDLDDPDDPDDSDDPDDPDDPEEQFRRGESYITYDLEKAKYWFEEAAAQGYSPAKARLKIINLAELNNCTRIKWNGEGEKIHNSVMRLSDRPQYWSTIGEHYFYGVVLSNDNILYLVHGLEPDMGQAEHWFSMAADIGDARGATGLYNLGMYYCSADVDNTYENAAHARELLMHAAKCGSEDAQVALDLGAMMDS